MALAGADGSGGRRTRPLPLPLPSQILRLGGGGRIEVDGLAPRRGGSREGRGACSPSDDPSSSPAGGRGGEGLGLRPRARARPIGGGGDERNVTKPSSFGSVGSDSEIGRAHV